jgi:hypothetical protein
MEGIRSYATLLSGAREGRTADTSARRTREGRTAHTVETREGHTAETRSCAT